MNPQAALLERIRRSECALLGPSPFAHSQELKDQIPLVRRHVGPGAWYAALESSVPAPDPQDRGSSR